MPDRLKCIVPFCRHTRGDRKSDPLRPGMEWICAKHWSTTNTTWRRRYGLFKRRQRWDLAARMWEGLKQQAVDLAH